jgi:hypothetical protein
MRPIPWLVCVLLPAAAFGQAQVTTELVPMRDGVRLATDVYLGPDWEPGPVLLVRTTYDKDDLADLGHALAGYGMFWMVIQDTRGRFASEGVDTVFRDDATDGADTLAWLLQQPWCDGRVGTLGASALGITQYLLAGQGPEGLTCQWADVATPDLYTHAMFQGCVFRKALVENWLAGQGSLHMLPELVAHPLLDAFWDPVRLEGRYPNVDWPAVHLGGFYDVFLQGTIEAFQRFSAEGGPGARGTQRLVLGPWTHGRFFNRRQGELSYPANAAWNEGQYLSAQLDWFNWCLKGFDTAAASWPPVRYYLMGAVDDPQAPGNEWREAPSWPPPGSGEQLWYLGPGGRLSPDGPPGEAGETAFPSDPADPVPTVCGANLTIPAGPCDQATRVEGRADVALWTSEVLEEPVTLAGRVWARLFFSADVPDCDLMVRLSDVYPDGRSMLVVDGALRARHRHGCQAEEPLEPGELAEGFVDLWSTAIAFAPGHRIRVSISGSNAPRFDPNPQTGEPFRQHTRLQAGTLRVQHGPATPSALVLPVLGSEPQPDGGTPDGDDGAEDAGQDGSADAGQDGAVEEEAGPDGGADEGADQGDPQQPDGGDQGCPPGTHPEVVEGQTLCAPDCRPGFRPEYKDGVWTCAEEATACACGAGRADAAWPWLALVLLAVSARRRRAGSR